MSRARARIALARLPAPLREAARRLQRGIAEGLAWPGVVAPRNVRAHRLQRDAPLPLDEEGARIVEQVSRTGFAVTTLARLFPTGATWRSPTHRSGRESDASDSSDSRITSDTRDTSDVSDVSDAAILDVAALRAAARDELLRASAGNRKPYLRFAFGEERAALNVGSPFLQVQVHPRVLAVVNAYKGLYARLYLSALAETAPDTTADASRGSQRWHRDPSQGDLRLIKMFVYLSDVAADDGPFRFVPATHLGGARGREHPFSWAAGTYPAGDDVIRALERDAVPILGAAGTVIFADTTGFHRGGDSVDRPRVMLTAEYTSPGSRQAHRIDVSCSRARAATLPFATRFALGLAR